MEATMVNFSRSLSSPAPAAELDKRLTRYSWIGAALIAGWLSCATYYQVGGLWTTIHKIGGEQAATRSDTPTVCPAP